jgi:hypothetical protein
MRRRKRIAWAIERLERQGPWAEEWVASMWAAAGACTRAMAERLAARFRVANPSASYRVRARRWRR